MKTRKSIMRFTAILTGLLVFFLTVKFFSLVSLAKQGKINSIEWNRYNYEGSDYIPIGSLSVTTSGAANSGIYSGQGIADYYEDFKKATGKIVEKYEGINAVNYIVNFSGYADPNSECTVVFTLPEAVGEVLDMDYFGFRGEVLSVSVSGNQMTVVVKGDENGEFGGFVRVFSCNPNVTAVGNWLDPLKTQLNIAADEEFGGNVKHTAEYTSNFSLPKEILIFLKDHPNTTLIYTYMRDELTPVKVKIEGSKVKLQDGVDWYGIDNLIKTYGVYK